MQDFFLYLIPIVKDTFENNISKKGYNDSYRLVFDFCNKNENQSFALYQKIKEFTKTLLKQNLSKFDNYKGKDLKETYVQIFSEWLKFCRDLKNMLAPLDKILKFDMKIHSTESFIYYDLVKLWKAEILYPLIPIFLQELPNSFQRVDENESYDIELFKTIIFNEIKLVATSIDINNLQNEPFLVFYLNIWNQWKTFFDFIDLKFGEKENTLKSLVLPFWHELIINPMKSKFISCFEIKNLANPILSDIYKSFVEIDNYVLDANLSKLFDIVNQGESLEESKNYDHLKQFLQSIMVGNTFTDVVQSGKTITISFLPKIMIWFNNELRLAGVPINMMPFCSSSSSPMICNLPSVPACDQIRLYGTPGIGTLNLDFLYPFNCTVVA
ncbi:hypothetical protein CYY_009837 [Polysphondylium violaceum]|uniref:Uncharacterized protein n=1 Tax=Polysphondylium violaceum TaxID=133409 RepID=A0A8J4PKT3_9MYCE|nr:hypothetical protein CYY_009837 [Polysphondylium violaceum]